MCFFNLIGYTRTGRTAAGPSLQVHSLYSLSKIYQRSKQIQIIHLSIKDNKTYFIIMKARKTPY